MNRIIIEELPVIIVSGPDDYKIETRIVVIEVETFEEIEK